MALLLSLWPPGLAPSWQPGAFSSCRWRRSQHSQGCWAESVPVHVSAPRRSPVPCHQVIITPRSCTLRAQFFTSSCSSPVLMQNSPPACDSSGLWVDNERGECLCSTKLPLFPALCLPTQRLLATCFPPQLFEEGFFASLCCSPCPKLLALQRGGLQPPKGVNKEAGTQPAWDGEHHSTRHAEERD